jgi:hypothetical protein
MKDTASISLSQWGCPEQWWDVSLYPGTETSLTHWAWEFLRRNPEYRRLWDELVLPYYDAASGEVDFDPYIRAKEPERRAWMARIASGLDKGSSFKIEMPDTLLEDRFGTWCDPRRGDYTPRFHVPGTWHYRPSRLMPTFTHELRLKGNEVAFVFDANLPLDAQLQRAKQQLENYRPRGAKDSRFRRDLFPSYLQVLDAIDADTPVAEIAETLFPGQDVYPEYRATKRVRNWLAAACGLRDSGYRGLVAHD